MVPGGEPIQPPRGTSPGNRPSLTRDHSWKVHGAVLTHHPFPCACLGGDSWKCPLGSWKQWWVELCQGWKTSVMAGGILLSEDSGICSWSGPPVLPPPPSWSHPGSPCVCPTPGDSGLTLKSLGSLPGASQPGLRAISRGSGTELYRVLHGSASPKRDQGLKSETHQIHLSCLLSKL